MVYRFVAVRSIQITKLSTLVVLSWKTHRCLYDGMIGSSKLTTWSTQYGLLLNNISLRSTRLPYKRNRLLPTGVSGPSTMERKLRIMVITMGGYRKQAMEEQLLESAKVFGDIVDVTFVDGVESRSLRSRSSFLWHCNAAGLLPEEEWKALKEHFEGGGEATMDLSKILENVPVHTRRCGANYNSEMHYSKEIWAKGKAINRGRSVFACLLAHLINLRRFVDEEFDLLLEDNVRLDVDWVTKVRGIQEVKKLYECKQSVKVHMMYYGWLGSATNIDWLLGCHRKHKRFQDTIFPFPGAGEIESELAQMDVPCSTESDKKRPGGNPIWGSYGYWMSKEGYNCLLDSLRDDVGSMLWKGKRQRFYQVKPVDKVIPRRLLKIFGHMSVQLPVRPVAFRAPMLTSKIHTQWDPEFCKSTTTQLKQNGMDWGDLMLSEDDETVVRHWRNTGEWKSLAALNQL